jgi:DNA-binding transcriptional LysR family regulator
VISTLQLGFGFGKAYKKYFWNTLDAIEKIDYRFRRLRASRNRINLRLIVTGKIVEFHQLRCFLAVIEEGGFSRATSRLHVSQPALSYQIKQLEQELGVRLFHRKPGGVTPTEAGRVLEKHAGNVLESARKANRAIEELSDGVVGEVRIGTANSVGIYFLPQVLWSMQEKFPGVSPLVLYRHSNEIVDLLNSNTLDIAMVANPKPDRRFIQETIIEERVSLVCGRTHPLFEEKVVGPSDLKGLQFISLTSKSPTGQLISDYLEKLDLNIEPLIHSDNTETVKKMVEVGLGVAFLPDMVTSSDVGCDGESTGRLSRIQVGPPLIRTISMVIWKHITLNKAATAFMDELRAHAIAWKGCVENYTFEQSF